MGTTVKSRSSSYCISSYYKYNAVNIKGGLKITIDAIDNYKFDTLDSDIAFYTDLTNSRQHGPSCINE